MSFAYEQEQEALETHSAELQETIKASTFKEDNVESFLKIVRSRTDIEELDARIIREFVDKIYVHKTEMFKGHKIQRIYIAWNFIGIFDPPSPENEYLKETSA